MNAYKAWQVGWVAEVLCCVAAVSFVLWGIWTADARGLVSIPLGVVGFFGGVGMAVWTAGDPPDRPEKQTKLSSEDRKELGRPRRQLEMEHQTRAMEDDLGIEHKE